MVVANSDVPGRVERDDDKKRGQCLDADVSGRNAEEQGIFENTKHMTVTHSRRNSVALALTAIILLFCFLNFGFSTYRTKTDRPLFAT